MKRNFVFFYRPSQMEEKDDIRGCIRCELIEMDWCTLRIRKYVTSQNTFVHGKENFNENTGACHWSWRVRIDGCDIAARGGCKVHILEAQDRPGKKNLGDRKWKMQLYK